MVDDDGDPDARLAALAVLDDLGATRVAALLRLRLRRAGVLRIPRGPRRTTRQSPAGLTTREVEVLDLLTDGATNAEIAAKLVISPRTAGHHVSAVLGKLGVRSRRDAAAAASRLRDGTDGAPDGPR
jgi:DNA-binding NarL/FixJ family response regulator